MKKLIALLLVLCTVVGLVACGKKTDSSAGGNTTTPTGGNTPNTTTDDPQFSMTPDKSPYNGKKLQIYGMGTEETYHDHANMGKGSYLWMMRAALEEWAAINGVTLEFKGSYNQNQMLADMSAGGAPDVVFQTEQFPKISNTGITSAFTEAEYNKLAEICGKGYLDLMTYKTKSHGVLYPWNGNNMLYYNKTMFENYGVKTPKEYFMEGTWTWDNLIKCMEETTKDVDSDGVIDTYGLPADSLTWCRLVNPWKSDETGKLVSTIDDPMIQDFFQFKYDVFTVKKVVLNPGTNKIQTNVIYPMYAMQMGDAEPYNFEHMYQSIPNGDELEVVPCPVWVGSNGETRNQLQWTQSSVSLVATCDEREAAVDMIAYMLKCGLKYMSDFSLGATKSNYPGIQGKCDVSKGWLEAFAKVLSDRAKDIKKVEFDQELIDKIYAGFEGAEWYTYQTFSGVSLLTSYPEITQMPPASSIPAIREKYQAKLDTFNSTYIK